MREKQERVSEVLKKTEGSQSKRSSLLITSPVDAESNLKTASFVANTPSTTRTPSPSSMEFGVGQMKLIAEEGK